MEKSVLRKEMKLLRKSMDKNDRTAKDKKIFENTSNWIASRAAVGFMYMYLMAQKQIRKILLNICLS